ncbi:MAG: ATP-dependent DNA ligase [Janthinobacterium lividum]
MLLAEVVTTSAAVAATRSRTAKVAALADLLRRVDAHTDLVAVVVSYLGGSLRQRRTGLGWRSLTALPDPAAVSTLTVDEVHSTFDAVAGFAGSGSQGRRAAAVNELFVRATVDEQRWLRNIITGEVRQGALDALVQDAAAQVAGVPAPAVRRAAMFAGSTVDAAVAALSGGQEALAGFVLEVGRAVLPMLASSATSVATALAQLAPEQPEGQPGQGRTAGTPVAVDTKVDGIRIQVHRDGAEVRIATRTLEDITARLPEVVEVVLGLPASTFVLDGEAIALDAAGRPRAFQETASRTAQASGVAVQPFFFDVLHLEGTDLVDAPLRERLTALDTLVPQRWRVPRLVTADPAAATRFAQEAVAAGHEGVVVKDLSAGYAAGRRAAAWVKVKPVHTLDLVVLAVEPGSGRRHGWLSNIHLGARDPDTGGFVMLGKTFKGMTDEMLVWQTRRFTELEVSRSAHVVTVRPEQVVEIAFDGLQRSTRYPGGVALRFARVLRYRHDKTPQEADTIAMVRALGPP